VPQLTALCCRHVVMVQVVNAQILSQSGEDSSGVSLQFDALVLATALSAALGSAMVGIGGNLPFALAPGMGLNSYFTYGVCLRYGMQWRVALTCCFVQGLLFMALSLLGACELLQQHAPTCIKKGVTIGLGLFQALVGFELMKLVVPGSHVLLALGDLNDVHVWISLVGMMLICVLMVCNVKGAMLCQWW
jgi:AGZA family xanthine/uracil permease-like MFS transporter